MGAAFSFYSLIPANSIVMKTKHYALILPVLLLVAFLGFGMENAPDPEAASKGEIAILEINEINVNSIGAEVVWPDGSMETASLTNSKKSGAEKTDDLVWINQQINSVIAKGYRLTNMYLIDPNGYADITRYCFEKI